MGTEDSEEEGPELVRAALNEKFLMFWTERDFFVFAREVKGKVSLGLSREGEVSREAWARGKGCKSSEEWATLLWKGKYLYSIRDV